MELNELEKGAEKGEREQDVELGLLQSGATKDIVNAEDIRKASESMTTTDEPEVTLQPVTSTQTNQLSLSEVEPVDIRIRNLAVDVDVSASKLSLASLLPRKRAHDGEALPTTKSILRNVSADMPSGSLTAIIGGSGSGKTSLLNTMAERMASGRLSLSGSTTFNGKEGIANIRSAYVMQQDILQPTLTVRETLQYSAELRLPPPTAKEQRQRIVEEVILELGLKDCANTRIGNHAHKGCSGGEKRRTSMGVQLLSNPSVLFLDEPTTGLDATSAFQLVRTLKGLAKKGRTIVVTIHQPRSEIWSLFDNLIVLSRGSPVYSGQVGACLPYFARLGFELPAFVNPAEYVIDIAAIDNRTPELEELSSARVEKLQSSWLLESQQRFHIPNESAHVSERRTPVLGHLTKSATSQQAAFGRQVYVLTSRLFKVTWRDPMGMSGSLVEAIFMGIVTGWVFFNLKEDQSGIRSREGALYTSAALQGYLILIYETYRLTLDIQLFDRERGEGVVGVLPWMISRRLARFPVEDLPIPLLYSCILYWMAGFRADPSQFFIFFSVVLLCQYIAVCFAMTCVAVSRNFSEASLIANMGYTIQSMACGFFIQSNSMPVYVRWLKWTAYVVSFKL
jgi:ABC-type multidrug transport system ATPase subunit